jgi:uncharacterized caspase-like protein
MSAALHDLGFEVTTLLDADGPRMLMAVRNFGRSLAQGGEGLFYYAGHGMQVEGHNYLIPVDADIQSEDELKFEGVDVGRILEKTKAAGNSANILILDACRDSPFQRSFRSSARGLAVVDAPRGSLIIYATAPGTTASDGDWLYLSREVWSGYEAVFSRSLPRWFPSAIRTTSMCSSSKVGMG